MVAGDFAVRGIRDSRRAQWRTSSGSVVKQSRRRDSARSADARYGRFSSHSPRPFRTISKRPADSGHDRQEPDRRRDRPSKSGYARAPSEERLLEAPTPYRNRQGRTVQHAREICGAAMTRISEAIVHCGSRTCVMLRNHCRAKLLFAAESSCRLNDLHGRGLALSEGHADSVLRAQDHHGAGFDGLARNQAEIVFSDQHAKNHEDLQHSVVSADTTPRPGPERQMTEGRVELLLRLGEAFVVENLRVRPVPRRMLHAVDKHHDGRAPRDVDISSAVVRQSHSVDHPKWRIETQRLQYDLSRKLELGNVGVTQRPFAEHGIELLPDSLDAIGTRA